jgi:hypothetical protein
MYKKKGLAASVVAALMLVTVLSVAGAANVITVNKELSEDDDSGSLNYGFILCRVCYMESPIWVKSSLPGQRVECVDLDTGELIAQGKTHVFGLFLFKFLPMGRDYKIIADTSYWLDSKKIEDLGFFQYVEFLFIIV